MKRKSLIAIMLSAAMSVSGCFAPMAAVADVEMPVVENEAVDPAGESEENAPEFEVSEGEEVSELEDLTSGAEEDILREEDVKVGKQTEEDDVHSVSADAANKEAAAATTKDEADVDGEVSFSFDESTGTLTINGSGALDGNDYGFYSYAGSVKKVIIGEGITAIGEYAFNTDEDEDFTALETVEIGSGVKSIGEGAFYECRALTGVTIPDVESLGDDVFAGCIAISAVEFKGSCEKWKALTADISSGLELVDITCNDGTVKAGAVYGVFDSSLFWELQDKTLTVFEDEASKKEGVRYMAGHWSSYGAEAFVEKMVIGAGIKTIGWDGFHPGFDEFADLREIVISDSVEEIGRWAFESCKTLESVEIGANTIGSCVFGNCSSLKEVIIGEGVRTIEDDAFYECEALSKVTISRNIESIASNAFPSDVKKFIFQGTKEELQAKGILFFLEVECTDGVYTVEAAGTAGELNWKIKDGTLTVTGEGEMTEAPWLDCRDKITHLIIGDGVTCISHEAFGYLYMLKDVVIGKGVKSIGEEAFYHCDGLEAINIPDNVESLGSRCFQNCVSLQKVTVSAGSIGTEAFYNCDCIDEIEIGSGVTEIGSYAFEHCSQIREITIPANVRYVDNSAFDSCSSLKTVKIASEGIYNRAFRYCRALESVTLGEEVKYISENAFEECESLKTIALPRDLQYIGIGAFPVTMEKITYPGTLEEYTDKNFVIPYITVECTNGEVRSGAKGSFGYINWEIKDDTLYIDGEGAVNESPWDPYEKFIKKVVVGDGITNIDPAGIHTSGLEYVKYNGTKEAWYQNINDAGYDAESFMYEVEVECTDGVIKPRAYIYFYTGNDRPARFVDANEGYYETGSEFEFGVEVQNGYCNPVVILGIGGLGSEQKSEVQEYSTGRYKFTVPAGYVEIDVSVEAAPGQWVYDEESKTLTIKTDAAYKDVDKETGKYAWHIYADRIESIVLEDGVTELVLYSGDYELDDDEIIDYKALKSIVIPDSVEDIDYIENLSSVAEISLPGRLFTDDEGTEFDLEGWSSLKNITIRKIPECDEETKIYITDTFLDVKTLETLNLPENIDADDSNYYPFPKSVKLINYEGTKAGWEEFGRPALHGVQVVCSDGTIVNEELSGSTWDGNVDWTINGDGLLTIKGKGSLFYKGDSEHQGYYYGFYSDFVKNIEIGSGIKSIGEDFSNFGELEHITIPASVTLINKDAFSDCHSLSGITYGGTKEAFDAAFGDNILSVPVTCSDGVYVSDFERSGTDCGGRISWSIKGDTLTISGEGAYDLVNKANERYSGTVGWNKYRDYIKHVIIEEGITYLGSYGEYTEGIFSNMDNITDIKLPSTLEGIGGCDDAGFGGCRYLKEIEIPENVTEIDPRAFRNCDALEKLILPANFYQNLKDNESLDAFDNIKNLKVVEYKGTKEQWEAIIKQIKEEMEEYAEEGEEIKLFDFITSPAVECSDGEYSNPGAKDSSSSSASSGDKDSSSSSAGSDDKDSSSSSSTGSGDKDSSSSSAGSDDKDSSSSSAGSEDKDSSSSSAGSEDKDSSSSSVGSEDKDSSSSSAGSEDKDSSSSSAGSEDKDSSSSSAGSEDKDSSSSSSTSGKDSSSSSSKDGSSSSAADVSENRVLPVSGAEFASSKDNFAPVVSSGRINSLVLDFSNVKKSGVSPDKLTMTVVKGTKFKTAEQVKEFGVSDKKAVKVKINKKTGLAQVTPKSNGWTELTMQDGSKYKITFTVETPKANKSILKLSVGGADKTFTIKELFGTDVDGGTLSIVKEKPASQAKLDEKAKTLTVSPKAPGKITLQYAYLNKKYKATITVK